MFAEVLVALAIALALVAVEGPPTMMLQPSVAVVCSGLLAPPCASPRNDPHPGAFASVNEFRHGSSPHSRTGVRWEMWSNLFFAQAEKTRLTQLGGLVLCDRLKEKW